MSSAPLVLAMDVDGVLLDPSRGGRGPWKSTLGERFGITPDDLGRTFFARYWSDVVVGRSAVLPGLEAAMAELGEPASAAEVLEHWLATDFVVDERAVAIVRRWALDGIPVVLATNQEHERAAYLHERLGRLVDLSGMVYSAALGVTKDDVRFYERAAAALGLADAVTVVFVDDSPENVATATNAGWHGVLCAEDVDWVLEVNGLLAS